MNELRGQVIFQLLRQRNFRNFYEGLDYSRANMRVDFLTDV
jgi:hypothetical protein